MRYLRIILQGFVLTLTNIASILIAFGIYKIIIPFVPVNQRVIQTPTAVAINIVIFLVWVWIAIRYFNQYVARKRIELILIYFTAMLWSPIIFVPLHYLTQGYLTSFANILILLIYQIPVNFLVLVAANWFASQYATEPGQR